MYKEILEKHAGSEIDLPLEPANGVDYLDYLVGLKEAYDYNENLLDEIAIAYLPFVEKVANGEELTPEEIEQAGALEEAAANVGTEQAAIEQAMEEANAPTLAGLVETVGNEVLNIMDAYIQEFGPGVLHAVADVISAIADDVVDSAKIGDAEAVEAIMTGVVAALTSYSPAAQAAAVDNVATSIDGGAPTAAIADPGMSAVM